MLPTTSNVELHSNIPSSQYKSAAEPNKMPIFNDLPRTLRTRRAEAVRNWPADAQCYVCLRTFGKKDDPTDIDEIACYPLSYPSCGHYVGSDCYRSMMSHNTVNVTCPFQCPVALDGPDPVPAWVRRLESIGMWETAELSTHALVECIPPLQRRLSELHEQAFRQELGPHGNYELWSFYVLGMLLVVLLYSVVMFFFWYALWSAGRLAYGYALHLFSSPLIPGLIMLLFVFGILRDVAVGEQNVVIPPPGNLDVGVQHNENMAG